MAEYRFRQDTSSDATGIVRTADNMLIPPNEELGAWRDYLVWKAVPNTPDPATATTLGDKRKQARLEVERQAEREFTKDLQLEFDGGRQTAVYQDALYREADLAVDDGSPTAAEYPLLDALPAAFGATLADKATTIETERTARLTRYKAVGAVYKEAVRAINAAANLAAVDAVVAAVTWPA